MGCLKGIEAVTNDYRVGAARSSLAEQVGDITVKCLQMGDRMASSKQRPDNVPEENVYNKMHWLFVMTTIVAIAAVALLINGAG